MAELGGLSFVSKIDNSGSRKSADELIGIFEEIGSKAEKYGIDIDKYIGDGIKNASDATKAFGGIADELSAKIAVQQSVVKSLSDQLKSAKDSMDSSSIVSERQKELVASLTSEMQAEAQELNNMKMLLAQVNEQTTQNGGGMESLRARIKDTKNEIANLSLQLRDMSAEQKNSDMARAMQQRIEELKKEASDLVDLQDDINREIKSGASDVGKFAALSEGMDLAVSSATALTGALEALGVSEKDAESVQAKIQSGLAVSNGLMKAQNLLQKESNLMVQIGNIQKWAATKAELAKNAATNAGTIATAKATIAQRVFNAVAKANPYVLLASAILSVIGALKIFGNEADETSEKEKKMADEAEKASEEIKSASEMIYNAHLKGADASERAAGELEAYRIAIVNFNGTEQDAINLIDQVNSKFGDKIGYIKNLAQAQEALTKVGKYYIAYLRYEAIASAITAEFGKIRVQEINEEITHIEAQSKINTLEKELASAMSSAAQMQSQMSKEMKALGLTTSKPKSSSSSKVNKTSGKTNSKKEKTAAELEQERNEKTFNEEQKLAELKRQFEASELQLRKESADKEIEELRQKGAERIAEIRKQREDLLNQRKDEALKKNPNADLGKIALTNEEEKLFADTIANERKFYIQQITEIRKNEKKKEEERRDAFLIAYGDYLDKRNAMLRQKDREVEAEENEWDKKTKAADWDKDIQALDNEFAQKLPAITKMFEDFSEKSKDAIKGILKDANALLEALDKGEWSEALANSIGLTKEEFVALLNDPDFKKQLKDAIKNLFNASKDDEGFFKGLKDSFASAWGKGSTSSFQKTEQQVSAVAKNVQSMNSLVKAFGLESTEFGQRVGAFANATQYASQAFNALKSGDIIGTVSALTESVKSLMDAFLGGYDWGAYNNMLKAYNALEKQWDVLIDKKKKYIEEAYGQEAKNVGQETANLIKAQSDAARKMAREWLSAGSSWRSHSQGYELNQNMSDEALRQAQKAFGKNWDQSILELSSEELSKLFNDSSMAQFWAELKAFGGDYYDMLMQIINETENLQNIQDAISKQMTFTTFDNLADNFADMLSDMESDAKDFSEDIEKQFQNAIIKSFVYQKYQGKLKAFYDRWADATSGGLEKGELETLRSEYMGIVNDAINERNAIADALGFKGSANGQSSTSGGFQAMGQDTADELNGRFTAIQMDVAQVRQMMAEMHSISLNNMGYLEDIAKNTFQLYQMNDRLGRIESYTSRL